MADNDLAQWRIADFKDALEAATLAPRTRQRYVRGVAEFAKWCASQGIDDPSEVTSKTIRTWLSGLLTDLARSTVTISLAALKRWSKWAKREGIIEENIADIVKMRNSYNKLPRYVDNEVLEMLLAHREDAVDVAREYRDRAIIELIYGSGLRASEVCKLHVGDLDLTNKQVGLLRTDRGRTSRVWLPLSEPAVKVLKRYLVENLATRTPGDTALFLSVRGGPLSCQIIYNMLQKRSGGLVTAHKLRATCAVHMLKGGSDLRATQIMMGFQTPETAERYARSSGFKLKKALEQHHPRG